MREKLMPSVQYLQRLGPEHIDQIFESAHWIFEQDPDIAFEVRFDPFVPICPLLTPGIDHRSSRQKMLNSLVSQ